MGPAGSPAFPRLGPEIIIKPLRKFSWNGGPGEGVPTRVM